MAEGTVAVAGGRIGGLAAAVALHRRGWRVWVRVLDRNPPTTTEAVGR